ncbi:(d)CMP kinase [uncultured Salinisphaera sp.]|uniref:(d)CMP kinase n=1 Tax=uncultured Salinisphaera sp. TaxID=359372 RepID=UPI0032B13A15|tara:strand:+ start:3450 stop:4145 length:696 start_codon:yes stop_codon:yes gene_type:complete
MSEQSPVITLDGPGGAGKGTLAGLLSDWLGWSLLDSGALYRLVGLSALRAGLSADKAVDIEAAAALARALDVQFLAEAGAQRIELAGEDVTETIRQDEIAQAASQWAAQPVVREALLTRQRTFAGSPGLIADGRDMGTVIFPDADLKIFVTASAEERARRRYDQLSATDETANLSRIYREIVDRDTRDASREASPLKPADDAYVIDTTGDNVATSSRKVRDLVVAKGWLAD